MSVSGEQLWTSMRVQDVPSQLWQLYFDYLWDPTPGSWVSTIAYAFRVIAIMIMFPFALLTLLDIVSYVIARTLGVVETTRASTSDKRGLQVPIVAADEASADDGGNDDENNSRAPTPTPGFNGGEEERGADGTSTFSTGLTYSRPHPTLRVQAPDAVLDSTSSTSKNLDAAPTAFFFSPTEEKNLELSGGNILSPAMSRQGSPSAERHPGRPFLHDVSPSVGDEDSAGEESTILLRRRGGAPSSDVPEQLD
ncbi:hypothetical protein SCHPADRAFT_901128 [Schizopora paradoxa]|uniref:Uncharacterized protein n=1 Tax=Schizopora paradoxa TaxID=27342 RepID=A0A0H2S5S7_9AGAM|nr:hypothetical protein SCHPADRAFT_901128 [Schizopora paradoxa]